MTRAPNKITDFVARQTVEDCKQMDADWATLENNGAIGECLLRDKAKELCIELMGKEDYVPIRWMERLVSEIWRRFAVIE